MSAKHHFSASRRKVLIGTAGVATLGILGGVAWGSLTNYRSSWIEQVVREQLPGVSLDPKSLQTFVAEMLSRERLSSAAVKATIFADRFVPWLPAHISKARQGLEGLERHVLTEYLLGSNFFRVADPKRAVITYYGPALACINPFMHSNEPAFSQDSA